MYALVIVPYYSERKKKKKEMMMMSEQGQHRTMLSKRSSPDYHGDYGKRFARNSSFMTAVDGDDKKNDESGTKDVVDLSGMLFDQVPSTLSINFSAITKLDLSNNNLESIPESMAARLVNVVELDLHSNQIKSLPNSIGCLSKLKTLNVSANLLPSLPPTIENCRLLEELNASFNELNQLPRTIGFELNNLKRLSIHSNKIAILPHSISHLTNLLVLDAHLNCLRSLPDDLENLMNLQTLNLSQNFQYLTAIPYSVGLLVSLVELDVSYNKIKALPDSIGCLNKLQKLRVEGNPLVSPPMDVVDQGLHVVKKYMCDRMNGTTCGKSNKKKSWLGKFAKCTTFDGSNMPMDEGFDMAHYRSINGISSPRYMGMFSPKRLFSPKSYLSRSPMS